MASVHSSLLAKNVHRISSLLFCILLIARAEAETGMDDVALLGAWKMDITPRGDGMFNFNPGGYFSTWNLSDPNPCAWAGVTCTVNFTVEALDLSGWELPSWQLGPLSALRDLRYLDLSSSNFIISDKNFSDDVGSLTELTHLDLSRSGLQNGIPADISRCSNLRYLSLEHNQLSGEIPSLTSMVNLQFLLLAGNNLSGPVPEISSLVSLDLSDNKFSGTFPSLSNFPNLVDLKLDNNNFTSFGEPLSDSTSRLERLFVSGNQFGGTIPTHITNLLNLEVLNMSRNQLSAIPSGFSRLWNRSLTSVDLSQNNLSGSVPADFLLFNSSTGFNQAVAVNLSHNLLSGSLPLDDGQFPRNSIVDISHNQLSGSVPLMLTVKNDQGINGLWLHNNQLSGDIVDILVQASERFYACNLYMSELHVDNNHFTGDLSRMVGKWGNICLKVVDLSNNYLHMSTTETIPDPLGATLQDFADNLTNTWFGTVPTLPSLEIQLHLAGNNFSGTSLPTTCFGTSSNGNYFTVLDISNNSLQGEILGEVFNRTCLPQLQFLNLSHNNASGPVPQSIFDLPNLLVLDVSSNNLSGTLPFVPTSSPFYDQRIFANNTGLCGDPLPLCPSNIPLPSRGVPWWALLTIVAVSLMSVVGSCLVATWRWRVYQERHRQDADLIKTLMERESTMLMPLWELKKATNDFAKSAQIGEGGFGTVYLGKLNDGTTVAIKKSKRGGSEVDKKQFLNEVRILTQVNHRSLVKLLGCCMENKIALLVFEFVSNGTLQDHLRGKMGTTHLSWEQRLNIAVQTTDALSYLHSATKFPIYHRDVKSANILLDNDFNAKVADFGISKLAPGQATHVSTVAIQGTMGYIDPEYYTSLQLTDKSDVYSFGVVLLELISAKPALDVLRGGEETSLVSFVRPHIEKGDVEQVIDPTLMKTYLHPIGCGRESILNVGRLALKCLHTRSKARPSMNEVCRELHNLWLKYIGTPQDLNSVDKIEGEAAASHHLRLLFESISGSDTSESTLESSSGSIQMSQIFLS